MTPVAAERILPDGTRTEKVHTVQSEGRRVAVANPPGVVQPFLAVNGASIGLQPEISSWIGRNGW